MEPTSWEWLTFYGLNRSKCCCSHSYIWDPLPPAGLLQSPLEGYGAYVFIYIYVYIYIYIFSIWKKWRESGQRKGDDCLGNREVHVSSPMKTMRRPLRLSWSTMLSTLAVSSGAPKLAPASMKVGKLPVTSAFNRCIVVVGGSATNRYSADWFGCLCKVSQTALICHQTHTLNKISTSVYMLDISTRSLWSVIIETIMRTKISI